MNNLKNPIKTASIMTKTKQLLESKKLVDAELLQEAVEVMKFMKQEIVKTGDCYGNEPFFIKCNNFIKKATE